MIAMDYSDIKMNNKKRIIKLLSEQRELTKLEISRGLDISVPTVTTIVGELIEEGLVEEAGTANSTGGRKPVIIRFLPDSRYSIGVNLDKDLIRAVLTNLDSKILLERKRNLNVINETEILSIMKSLIQELLSAGKNIYQKLLGIGFSLPGTVNEKDLKLEVATNFRLKNLSFKEMQEQFKVPIYLENEANAGALAESKLGIAKDMNNLIYISITEGVGGGIIINKSMYKGKSMRAGEIGHMTINKSGRLCNCGKKGCWETYASNRALINDYNEASNKKVHDIGEILEKYENNDESALNIIDKYIENLADGIGNLIFIFNPDYIVLGGEISKYSNIFHDKLTARIFDNNEFYNEDEVEILFSTLGSDSNILGASLIPVLEDFGFDEI